MKSLKSQQKDQNGPKLRQIIILSMAHLKECSNCRTMVCINVYKEEPVKSKSMLVFLKLSQVFSPAEPAFVSQSKI